MTLTATVSGSSSTPVRGLVVFCDAAATSCTASRALGSAQLTSAGVATLPFLPAIGSHSYKAVFAGTTANASSTSAAVPLMVTGSNSATTLVASGGAGNYTLKASVISSGKAAPPTGILSLLDLDNASVSLGMPTLGSGTDSFSFLSGTQTITNNDAVSVLTADFNQDGYSDLAILHYKSSTVEIRLSNGDGTFRAGPVAPSLSSDGFLMVVGDFNEDGIPDIAATNQNDTVDVLLGKGDGSFTRVGASPQGYAGFLMTVGDFNGDGHADIAVGGLSVDVNILLGDGTGHFAQTSLNAAPGFHPRAAAAGDFNGDGLCDLVLASGADYTPLVYLSNGDGSFTAGPVIPTLYGAIGVTVGDFNGDGKLDIAAADNGNAVVSVLQGAGDGTFTQRAVLRAGSTPIVLTVGDLEGDGRSDIAVANETSK